MSYLRHEVDAETLERLISTPELCRLSGISYREADYWTRIGVLEPVVDASGSGSQRLFDRREADVARAVKGLRASIGARDAPAPLDSLIMRGVILHVREHGLGGRVIVGPFTIETDQLDLTT